MLEGQYESHLVWMSILVAWLASYTSLSLAHRLTYPGAAAPAWWIAGSAFAMGTGIWAMHFIGMLAFRLPIRLGYDFATTFLSWTLPVVMSTVVLRRIATGDAGRRRLGTSACLLGGGISAMHYVGMRALQLDPEPVYAPALVILSVLIGISAAAFALWVVFVQRRYSPHSARTRAVAAAVMGMGIAGLHYVGMAATSFPLGSVCTASQTGLGQDGLAHTVGLATFSILVIALLTSGYEHRLFAKTRMLALTEQIGRERELLLQSEQEARAMAEKALAGAEAAWAEAERLSAVKDEFLASLSHELRTPLNAILGWAQLLQKREQDEVTRNALAVIDRNARAQSQMIEDLLDMGGVVSGRVRLERRVLDPAPLLLAAIETATPAAQAKSIVIRQALDRFSGPVWVDDERLQQVVSNLLNNAIKFTPSGGEITVFLRRAGEYVEIVVSDTGAGIDAVFLPHVFEMFRQADESTTRRHGGLGIGLAIARQLVVLHGGKIRAASEGLGKGATFTVALPIASQSAAADQLTAPAHEHARSGRCAADLEGIHVLLVEGDGDAGELLRVVLETCNATVTATGSYAEALRLAVQRGPDVLISDFGMPDMDGIALMNRLRAQGFAAPSIAISAFTRNHDRESALAAGYGCFLTKPVDFDVLVTAVAALADPQRAEATAKE